MASIRQRLVRLETRAAETRPSNGPIVQLYIPDNGRGELGPGTYCFGRTIMTVFQPSGGFDGPRSAQSSASGVA
jgi:hypothetical protein